MTTIFPEEDWVRNATLQRVIDGDTVEVVIDLGCRNYHRGICRLWGIDAPEVRGLTRSEGLAATEFLKQLLTSESPLVVRIHKDTEKYGRWLVELFVNGKNINQEMIQAGHAVSWDSRRK